MFKVGQIWKYRNPYSCEFRIDSIDDDNVKVIFTDDLTPGELSLSDLKLDYDKGLMKQHNDVGNYIGKKVGQFINGEWGKFSDNPKNRMGEMDHALEIWSVVVQQACMNRIILQRERVGPRDFRNISRIKFEEKIFEEKIYV